MPLDPLLMATAVEIVLRAGEIQLAKLGTDVRVDKKGAIDLVTNVDLEVERMCRERLAERFPHHRVLGEELSGTEMLQRQEGPVWVFDPLDGTTNYAHGLPIFCSALSFEEAGRTELAAVYDPTRRELFTAERGLGAFMNGTRLHVSAAPHLTEALVCTGFPYNLRDTVDEILGLFGRFVARARAVRRLGSAAIDLCYVAAGRLDGFWERYLMPWDIAAGALIVEEAGGQVTRFDGSAFDQYGGEVVASNGRIHGDMLDTIERFSAEQRGVPPS